MYDLKLPLKIPKPIRPRLPSYGIDEGENGLLSWEFVSKIMSSSRNYWIGTVGVNNKPHVRPIWGIWFENYIFFSGGEIQWKKNVKNNPLVTIHSESGDNVIIIEGVARLANSEISILINQEYHKKYKMEHGSEFWALVPEKVFAWTLENFANSPTLWKF